MQMPGRKFSTGSAYRYGFNGKENDNEVKGEGNQIDYGMRIYDPRLGRFLSVDPLFEDYPWYTPYQFAGNSPIVNIDLDGEEEKHYLVTLDEKTGKLNLNL
jgi:RHS repeat-associated protein